MVLSDEVYWALRYGGKHHSVLDFDGLADRTVLLDGWSKTFAMTGWRLGFGVFPPALVSPVTRLVINSVSCTSAFSQYAAIAALEGPWDDVERMVAAFRERRDAIVSGLGAIPGVSCVQPDGAFYAFPNVRELGMSAATPCPTYCSSAQAWPAFRAPRSARTARGICGSPTPTPSTTSAARWQLSRPW